MSPNLDQLRADQATLRDRAKALKGKKTAEARRQAKTINDEFTAVTRMIKRKEQEDASKTDT